MYSQRLETASIYLGTTRICDLNVDKMQAALRLGGAN